MNPESHVREAMDSAGAMRWAGSRYRLDGKAMCFSHLVVDGLRQEGGRRVFYRGKHAT